MNSEKSRDRQSQMSPDKLSISGGSIIKIEQHSARNLSGLGTMRITGYGVQSTNSFGNQKIGDSIVGGESRDGDRNSSKKGSS